MIKDPYLSRCGFCCHLRTLYHEKSDCSTPFCSLLYGKADQINQRSNKHPKFIMGLYNTIGHGYQITTKGVAIPERRRIERQNAQSADSQLPHAQTRHRRQSLLQVHELAYPSQRWELQQVPSRDSACGLRDRLLYCAHIFQE